MTQEKVLWFLGLEKKQKIDKYVMKYAFGSDFLISIFIIICGLLFEVIPITFSNIIWIAGLLVVDVVFLKYLKRIYNPVYSISYSFAVMITTTVKLAYGFFMFSKAEMIKDGYPIIMWAHIVALAFAVLVAVFMIFKNYVIWQDLKENTVEYVVTKICKKNKKSKWKWIAIILGSSSPIVFVRLLDDGMSKIGLGMGFGFWLLACCWFLMASLLIPKFIVSMKYRAFEWFQNEKKE